MPVKLTNFINKLLFWRKKGQPTVPQEIELELTRLQTQINKLADQNEELRVQIQKMRREYEALLTKSEEQKTTAGKEELERLFSRLCHNLAVLVTLSCQVLSGKDTDVKDLAQMILAMEQELIRLGLERLGSPGEKTVFDIAQYRAMGVETFEIGAPVVIRIPGYKFNDTILLKATVSGLSE